jgi:integration host factor subunit alpha
MTKDDLTNAITEIIGFSKKDSQNIVDQTFELMKSTLESGKRVKISGFGVWNVNTKKVRRGRNPATGEPMEIAGRRVVVFKASGVLKGKLSDKNAVDKLTG